MIRLFVQEKLSTGFSFELDEKKTHYLIHVMRLGQNDVVLLFNGKDGEFEATLIQVKKKSCTVLVGEKTKKQTSRPELILCPAIIKKENMDLVLQKTTELGVTKIFPLITDRTVVRGFNLERANLIVQEAAEQSERLDVPVIYEPIRLKDLFLNLPKDATPVFLTERGTSGEKTLFDVDVPAFIIGPEGGFTSAEVNFVLKHQNVVPLHLGDTILRAETASIVAVGLVLLASKKVL